MPQPEKTDEKKYKQTPMPTTPGFGSGRGASSGEEALPLDESC